MHRTMVGLNLYETIPGWTKTTQPKRECKKDSNNGNGTLLGNERPGLPVMISEFSDLITAYTIIAQL